MAAQHTLVLPFPDAYATNAREHFSFFTSPASGDDHSCSVSPLSSMTSVNRYADDLCDLLQRTRLIQRHPDKYFQYVRGEAWRSGARHIDGAPVSKEELDYTNRLCDAFTGLIPADDGALDALRQLLRDGPPVGCAPELMSLFTQCRSLMLHRIPRSQNDSACFTLLQEPAQRAALEKKRNEDTAQEARRRQILQLVLSYGMSAKKKHEVPIMRDTIRDLIDCTNTALPSAQEAGHAMEPVRTVVNVGEGKGYVSRALALCDRAHVIGLDCNPSHRERAIERFETLLEGSLSLRPAATHTATSKESATAVDGPRRGKDMVSLLYEPRGDIVSIACRVDSGACWRDVLQGHTPVVEDGAAMPSDVRCAREADADNCDASPAVPQFASRKGMCKACGSVLPLEKTLVLLKHIHQHQVRDLAVKSGAEPKTSSSELPSPEELQRWNRDLPQAQLQRKLMEAFFAPCDIGAHKALVQPALGVAPQPPKRERDEHSTLADHDASLPVADGTITAGFMRAHIARGLRVLVLAARPVVCVDGDAVATARYEVTTLTVIGCNDATDAHTVIFDEGTRKERCHLWHPPAPAAPSNKAQDWATRAPDALAAELSEEWRLPSAETLTAPNPQQAVVLCVHQRYTVTVPAVRVPSLSNTVFVGLHTCGDLGSNTCRLFVENRSRGLLLVSCCWQAMTQEGFPLSQVFRSRGMSTDKVSLLLATQPLDMWATASAEGHRSSARILFFRTLLIMLWDSLREGWGAAHADGAETRTCNCPFAPEPLLESTFLRRINRVKETLSFPAFAEQVCSEYIYAATAKSTAYTWHSTVCEACRHAQEAFFHAQLAPLATGLAETYMTTHFPRFIGLTVLRMWMCHLVESLFLLDRAFYLHEELCKQGGRSTVSLVPLFDGSISPRMYGILALRENAS